MAHNFEVMVPWWPTALLDSPEQLAVGGGGDVVGARNGGERPCGAVGSALWQMLRIGSAPFLMAG